jgi:hypothetical protein
MNQMTSEIKQLIEKFTMLNTQVQEQLGYTNQLLDALLKEYIRTNTLLTQIRNQNGRTS